MDRLKSELGAELQVIQLDVTAPSGREVGRRLGWEFTPTFILFDRQGKEAWRRAGVLDPADVRTALQGEG